MSHPPAQKNIIRLSGFYFGDSDVFSSRPMATRVYDALLAAAGVQKSMLGDIEEVRSRVAGLIHRLFSICIEHITLFVQVRGGSQFWATVAEQWLVDVQTGDVEEIINVFIDARRRYEGSSTTYLTQTVDQWMSQAAGGKWPSSHFNEREAILLNDPRIRHELMSDSSDQLPPLPTNLSPPIEVKKFLCLTALKNTTPATQSAIYLTPIAFTDDRDRHQWHNATGSLSEVYGTVGEFITYAQDCFASRGKDLVVGIFHSWAGTTHQINAAYNTNSGGRRRDEFWAQSCRRRSIVIALHKTSGQGGVEVKLFDPTIALAGGHPRLTMTSHVWKTDFLDQIQRSFPGESWHGGRIYWPMASLGVPLEDEVQVSCAFAWVLATGFLDIDGL
ncbi:hypothetical protein F4818DRAFT_439878 [Hypoxylon cercidicola]|nr:hypothetical protein F4818DRAFT_439878 [Hypoxylon cercidicola]